MAGGPVRTATAAWWSPLVLVLVVIGAGAAAVWFLLQEIWAYRVEWAAAAAAFFAIMGTAGALMYPQNRNGLPVDESAKAEAIVRRLALPAAARPAVAAPVTVTHHHYDERQVTVVSNDQLQLHVHVAEPVDKRRRQLASG